MEWAFLQQSFTSDFLETSFLQQGDADFLPQAKAVFGIKVKPNIKISNMEKPFVIVLITQRYKF